MVPMVSTTCFPSISDQNLPLLDIANAVGPLAAVYATYNSGEVNTRSPTPVWILVIGGLLLGLGFWFFGYHIIRE
jgi:PiT family inorganic phosphate transporter